MGKKLILLILFSIFLTQTRAETTQEERVYILADVWRNVRDNFAFPQHFQQADPDSLFKTFLPRILNAGSETDFSLLMTEFMAKFGDAHTRFFAETPSATVPVRFVGLDNKVYVSNIGKQYVRKIPVGSQLLSIDGQPVGDFLNDKIYPYIAASNDDWRFRKSLDTFLNGDPETEVVLKFLTPAQTPETITLERIDPQLLDAREWAETEDPRAAYVEMLPGNIAYMRMSTFTRPDEVNTVFVDNLAALQGANGVIMDIRGNRGGSDESWNPTIIDHIASGDIDQNSAFIIKCRVANNAFQELGGQVPQFKDYVTETAMDKILTGGSYFSNVSDSLKIKSPVILLTDGYTGSSAEDFAATMKNLGLARLVGPHTVGVISHPRYFDLPGGYRYGLSTWAFFNPDGTSIIDTGILPDIEVEYTPADLINGTDPQLTHALRLLTPH